MIGAVWNQQNEKSLAEVHRFHDGESEKYLYRIYEKWVGQSGQLVAGPMVKRGVTATLPGAKRIVLKYLGG